jgi:two-component system OmpR family sensor kinase
MRKRLMNRLMRRFSSVRARLSLWNTFTFALVLITLGVSFRFLAERYLLDAMDREIKMQAQRFQESHRVAMTVISSAPLQSGDVSQSIGINPPFPLPAKRLRVTTSLFKTQFHLSKNIGYTPLDQSGQFLYRTFDLQGKPLSSPLPQLPFKIALLNEIGPHGEKSEEKTVENKAEKNEEKKRPEDYRPWDAAGFAGSAQGGERFSKVEWSGARMRVLSRPLRETVQNGSQIDNRKGSPEGKQEKIIGVVQIATSLEPVYRDIAGLTRTLLLTLPFALLVAAGAGIFLTDRALRPVKSLTRAANEIRPDQLSQRLPTSGADEFDALAMTFNRALDRVELAFVERERAMQQLRRFTADASHELRTPLTTIKANTGVALTEVQPSAEHIHALRQIDRAADRMTALVRDLLLLARSEAGQIPLALRPVCVDDILRDALDALPSSPHAPLFLDVVEAGLIVCGDPDHLCRLFLNLLENAARHTPENGEIRVTLAKREGQAWIRVQDTGCGIAPEHLPHVSEPFYRVDQGRDRKQGGAGLGLAICRSIATQHQGTLSIESQSGEGTQVTVCLPLAQE